MKLVRFGEPGRERPGLWLDDRGEPEILDVRGMAFDIADYHAHFFAHGGLARLRGLLTETRQKRLPARGLRLGPPVARPSQIICVGKNYADHAAEFDAQIPAAPILFAKSPSTLIGHQDTILRPAGCTQVDAEAELGLIIGRTARHLTEAQALEAVAGFTCLNDVTERSLQKSAGQWFLGKSPDTFCPLGPWLVTPDEVADPQALRVTSRLNGNVLQDGNTRHMLFPLARLLAYLTSFITLQPGDVVATGTPAGVGFARTPPVFLQPGDRIEVAIEGVGTLANLVGDAR